MATVTAQNGKAAVDAPPEHGSLMEALHGFQGEAVSLQKDRINPAFKSKYLSLDSLMEQSLPVLNRHGLVWVTMPVARPEGNVLHYRLIHAKSGQEIAGEMPLMLTKQDPQGLGSAITYARRQSFMAVLGLTADEDDDGAKASRPAKKSSPSGPRPLTETEQAKVETAVAESGNDLLMVLGAVGAESLDELTTAQAFEIRKLLDGGS